MARLVIDSGVDSGMVYPLTEEITTLGRSPSNTIQIIDRKVSRFHSEIQRMDNQYILKDLGSKNGTYINDQLITEPYILQNNDKIRIGDTIMYFEMEASEEEGRDTTTRSVRLVAEPEWGQEKKTISVVSRPELAYKVDATTTDLLKDSTHRLEILYKVGETIRNILDVNTLLNKIMEILFNVIQPDRGCILLKDEKTGQFTPRVVKTREEEEISISQHIVERCVLDKVSILVSDATTDQRFKEAESVIMERIRSAMCSPLVFKDEVFGVIYVDTRSRLISYGQEELELLTGVANQAAMAIVNARLHERLVEQSKLEKELEIARTIQMNLLPRSDPEIENFEVAATSIPAKKVGGDYYDFIKLPQGQWGIAVGDVSGKGVPAAILIATVRALLKSESTRPRASVTSVVSKVNVLTCHDVTGNIFITLVYGVLNPHTRSFEYTNAGHCPPLLFDPQGNIHSLTVGGFFMGLMENTEYKKEVVKLPPGSVLLIYSDGLVDTMDPSGNFFGLERLKKLVSENRTKSATEIRDIILHHLNVFRGDAEVFDDMTLVVIKSL